MRSQSLATHALAFVVLFATIVSAAESTSKDTTNESPIDRVKWQKGPSSGALGSLAQIKVPEKYIFAGGGQVFRARLGHRAAARFAETGGELHAVAA